MEVATSSALHKPRYSVSRAKIQPPNRVAIGKNVAVLFCPAKGGRMVGVPIDKADLPRVLSLGLWRVANHYPKPYFRLYAYAFHYENGQRKRTLLHRFLTQAPAGTEVDHGNHRGTDNRRAAVLAERHRPKVNDVSKSCGANALPGFLSSTRNPNIAAQGYCRKCKPKGFTA